MKIHPFQKILFVFILILLSACQPSAASPAAAPTQTVEAPQLELNGYPAPNNLDAGVENAYPAQIPTLRYYAEGELPTAPETAPQPQSGMAAISGTLFSFTQRMVLPETNFYLAALDEEGNLPPILAGAKTDAGDIPGRSDAQGNFTLDNVKPGKYILVVWGPYNWSIMAESVENPSSPRIIEAKADQSLPLGITYFSWP